MKRSITYKKFLCYVGVPVFALAIAFTSGCWFGDDDDDDSASGPTKIYMFNNGTAVDGKLGGDGTNGRTAADALCSANKPSGVTITTVHAFISVSSSDSIANMPTTYSFPNNIPIYGPNGTSKLADTWADLLDSSISMTLQSAGVFSSAEGWWSGSNSDGTLHTYNCVNWTSTSGSEGGRIGFSDKTDAEYINYSVLTPTCDAATRKVVCIGY